MTDDERQLRTTLEQIGRIGRSLDDIKKNVLPKNPDLFATLAEGYVEELNRLTREIEKYLVGAKSAP